ncbi:floral homeotic protein DEFICIENS-like protein, partial [Tanacetum coccineum]
EGHTVPPIGVELKAVTVDKLPKPIVLHDLSEIILPIKIAKIGPLMQEELRQQKEVNINLRKQTRQRLGDCLEDLGFEELLALEKDSNEAVYNIRDRKRNMFSGALLHNTTAQDMRERPLNE